MCARQLSNSSRIALFEVQRCRQATDWATIATAASCSRVTSARFCFNLLSRVDLAPCSAHTRPTDCQSAPPDRSRRVQKSCIRSPGTATRAVPRTLLRVHDAFIDTCVNVLCCQIQSEPSHLSRTQDSNSNNSLLCIGDCRLHQRT